MAIVSVSANKCLVPWTVFQADPDASFLNLFNKITSGKVSVIETTDDLSRAELERVFVGTSKEILSVVDCHLLLSDVCKVFGQFVRYNVVIELSVPVAQEVESERNAFTILMSSSAEQSAAQRQPLPDLIRERTKKDKLHNAIIGSMEKNGVGWKSQGRKHGGPFVRCLTDALWYFDGHQQTLREAGYPVPDYFKGTISLSCRNTEKELCKIWNHQQSVIMPLHRKNF